MNSVKCKAFGDFEYKTPTRIDATHAPIFIPGIQSKNIQIQLESNFHPKFLFFSFPLHSKYPYLI